MEGAAERRSVPSVEGAVGEEERESFVGIEAEQRQQIAGGGIDVGARSGVPSNRSAEAADELDVALDGAGVDLEFAGEGDSVDGVAFGEPPV